MTRAAVTLLALALAACEGPAASPPPPSARCASCHRAEYESEHGREPVERRKPMTCAVCHVERTWSATEVRHAWPLTGAHADARCTACHRPPAPVYEGTPTACVACHRDDAARARNPPHAGLPTTCASCHTTAAWSPATAPVTAPAPAVTPPARPPAPAVTAPAPARPRAPTVTPPTVTPSGVTPPAHPESRFPIARGDHANITCQRCHDRGGPNRRDNTDCVQCHARARFDPIHDRVRQYPSGAAAPNFCVLCHTRGTRSRR